MDFTPVLEPAILKLAIQANLPLYQVLASPDQS